MTGAWAARPPAGTVGSMDLTENTTILIPGATSGIGLALALRLQARGSTVIIAGRRKALLDELAAAHGFATVEMDTTDPASIEAAATRVLAEHPELDALLLSAGIMEPEDYRSPTGFLDVAERTVATNLLGPIRVIAAFVEHLQTRPAAAVYTVSSGLAFVPLALTPTYNATKAAIHMLSEGIRLQLRDTSVQVTEIVPPAVRTALMGQEEVETSMPLDEFADEVMALLDADPTAPEILVERVGFLRGAVARGEYAQVVAAVNGIAH
jgi:uncharacterized oxidoreductase